MTYNCLFSTYCIFVGACECLHVYVLVLYMLAAVLCKCREFSYGPTSTSHLCAIPRIPHRANKSQVKSEVGPTQQHKSALTVYTAHTLVLPLPATLATLSASWLFAPLERLGLRCLAPPGAERMLRRCTSVALKKATMKGCLF